MLGAKLGGEVMAEYKTNLFFPVVTDTLMAFPENSPEKLVNSEQILTKREMEFSL